MRPGTSGAIAASSPVSTSMRNVFSAKPGAQHLVDLFHQPRRRAARQLAVIPLDGAKNRARRS